MISDMYPNLSKYEIRENNGSLAYNRLAMQISFAMQKIFELYKHTNFTINLDCIDDVVIFKTSEKKPNITTYQIKTKDSNAGNFALSSLTTNNVFKKMYDHIEKLDEDVQEIVLVSNLSLKHGQKIISGELITLNKVDEKIRELIEKDLSQSLSFSVKGFSDKLKFSQVDMSIKNHIDIARSKLNELLIKNKIDISLISAEALFKTLLDILHSKQSYEFSLQDNILTILPKKSYSNIEFEDLIKNATSKNDLLEYKDLISLYNIKVVSLSEEAKYRRALATFKDKLNSAFNQISIIMETVTSFALEKLDECILREELLIHLTQEFERDFEILLSHEEKEILYMNCIEMAIRGD